jgi:hypothetical protein
MDPAQLGPEFVPSNKKSPVPDALVITGEQQNEPPHTPGPVSLVVDVVKAIGRIPGINISIMR